MKQLIIPIVIAILAGVGGGSGFAYMRASKAFAADSSQHADSVKANPPKKEAEHDSTAANTAHDSISVASAPIPTHEEVTPADSIRALVAARATLKAETKGLADAKAAAVTGTTVKVDGAAETHAAAKPVAKVETLQTSLPEQRLAKIFGAMQAKEAAKVLEQMTDGDVRTILSMMSDRQAAAILTSFSPQRAAVISKGAVRAPEGNTDGKPESKLENKSVQKPDGKAETKPVAKP